MKSISKKAKRRMVFVFVILFSLVTFLSISLFNYWTQIFDNIKQTKKLTSEYHELIQKEESLEAEANKLEDPEYIAKYAKENYLFSKDGEKIIRIVE